VLTLLLKQNDSEGTNRMVLFGPKDHGTYVVEIGPAELVHRPQGFPARLTPAPTWESVARC
jgi:hypothetical protein